MRQLKVGAFSILFATALGGIGSAQAGSTPMADTRVHAVLQGSSVGKAFGQAWHRSDMYDAAHFRDHFRMYLRVRRRTADPSLLANADDRATLLGTLTRNGVAYAECVFSRVADRDIDFIPDDRRFLDFGVATENIGGDTKAPRGTCDTDLSSPGVQRGVPDVQASDVLSVTILGGPSAGLAVAQGTFAAAQ